MQAITTSASSTVGRAAAFVAAGNRQILQSKGCNYTCSILMQTGTLQKQLLTRQFVSTGRSFTQSIIPSGLSRSRVSMGIEKEVVKQGTGPKPQKGQTVTVHCTGYGKNRDLSQKFWSTKDPGQEPFTFKVGLGQVIKGWDEGVLNMQKGEVSRLTCSPDYAYGAGGFPAWGIQPNSTLLFEIEVLNFK